MVFYAILKVFKVGDNFDSKLQQFHIFAPLYEKHFWPLADFRMGISKSDLVFRNSLLQPHSYENQYPGLNQINLMILITVIAPRAGGTDSRTNEASNKRCHNWGKSKDDL